MMEFRREAAWQLPVGVDEHGVAHRAWGVRAYPTVCIVDRTGRIAYRGEGHAAGAVEAQLAALLGE